MEAEFLSRPHAKARQPIAVGRKWEPADYVLTLSGTGE